MVKVAEDLLRENQSIEKVILMDCIPRFDLRGNDPYGLKPILAKLSNNLNRETINRSGFKDKIVAGVHTIDGNEVNFGNPDETPFDGIHMYGRAGCQNYTQSIIKTLSNQMQIQHVPRDIPSGRRTKKNRESNPRTNGLNPSPARPASGPSTSSTTRTTGSSVLQYAVKTFNRFSTFLQ